MIKVTEDKANGNITVMVRTPGTKTRFLLLSPDEAQEVNRKLSPLVAEEEQPAPPKRKKSSPRPRSGRRAARAPEAQERQ